MIEQRQHVWMLQSADVLGLDFESADEAGLPCPRRVDNCHLHLPSCGGVVGAVRRAGNIGNDRLA